MVPPPPQQLFLPADPPAQIWLSALLSGGVGGMASTCFCSLVLAAARDTEGDVIAVTTGGLCSRLTNGLGSLK